MGIGVYEVTVRVLVPASCADEAEGHVRGLIEDEEEAVILTMKSKDTGADRMPPEGLPVSAGECLGRFGIDPWNVLGGEKFDCFIATRNNDDSAEARVNPARGLLCIVWHVEPWVSREQPGAFLQNSSKDPRDDRMEQGRFCGGHWDYRGGRKVFFYTQD